MKNSSRIFAQDDLVSNPTARVPVCLVLDVSGSMAKAEGQGSSAIAELNRGVKLFYRQTAADEIARYSAEVAVVTFGGSSTVQVVSDFKTLDENERGPEFQAAGNTPMAEAVLQALKMLDERKNKYKESGVDYFQPWLVLMTDGIPTSDPGLLAEAIGRTVEQVNARKLTVFPIGIGSEADLSILRRFSPKYGAMRLKGLNFCEFFAWLSQSVSRTSQSMPGERIELDESEFVSWADI